VAERLGPDVVLPAVGFPRGEGPVSGLSPAVAGPRCRACPGRFALKRPRNAQKRSRSITPAYRRSTALARIVARCCNPGMSAPPAWPKPMLALARAGDPARPPGGLAGLAFSAPSVADHLASLAAVHSWFRPVFRKVTWWGEVEPAALHPDAVRQILRRRAAQVWGSNGYCRMACALASSPRPTARARGTSRSWTTPATATCAPSAAMSGGRSWSARARSGNSAYDAGGSCREGRGGEPGRSGYCGPRTAHLPARPADRGPSALR
jgi:hypothetical protein